LLELSMTVRLEPSLRKFRLPGMPHQFEQALGAVTIPIIIGVEEAQRHSRHPCQDHTMCAMLQA
jgi:hypothetical protein